MLGNQLKNSYICKLRRKTDLIKRRKRSWPKHMDRGDGETCDLRCWKRSEWPGHQGRLTSLIERKNRWEKRCWGYQNDDGHTAICSGECCRKKSWPEHIDKGDGTTCDTTCWRREDYPYHLKSSRKLIKRKKRYCWNYQVDHVYKMCEGECCSAKVPTNLIV